MLDLAKKEYVCFVPVITEHLPFDIIAYKNSKCYRIQVKHSVENHLATKNYQDNDFDYYAIYNPNVKNILYPSIKYRGCTLTHEIPNSATPFSWYEDFLDFTDNAVKRTYKDFDVKITFEKTQAMLDSYESKRSKKKPSKDELEKLIFSKPMTKLTKDLDVSDRIIGKWCESYSIVKPPIGYWARKTT